MGYSPAAIRSIRSFATWAYRGNPGAMSRFELATPFALIQTPFAKPRHAFPQADRGWWHSHIDGAARLDAIAPRAPNRYGPNATEECRDEAGFPGASRSASV